MSKVAETRFQSGFRPLLVMLCYFWILKTRKKLVAPVALRALFRPLDAVRGARVVVCPRSP